MRRFLQKLSFLLLLPPRSFLPFSLLGSNKCFSTTGSFLLFNLFKSSKCVLTSSSSKPSFYKLLPLASSFKLQAISSSNSSHLKFDSSCQSESLNERGRGRERGRYEQGILLWVGRSDSQGSGKCAKKKLALGVEPKDEVWFHPPRPKKDQCTGGCQVIQAKSEHTHPITT